MQQFNKMKECKVLKELEKLKKELKEKDPQKAWDTILSSWHEAIKKKTFCEKVLKAMIMLIEILYEEKNSKT